MKHVVWLGREDLIRQRFDVIVQAHGEAELALDELEGELIVRAVASPAAVPGGAPVALIGAHEEASEEAVTAALEIADAVVFIAECSLERRDDVCWAWDELHERLAQAGNPELQVVIEYDGAVNAAVIDDLDEALELLPTLVFEGGVHANPNALMFPRYASTLDAFHAAARAAHAGPDELPAETLDLITRLAQRPAVTQEEVVRGGYKPPPAVDIVGWRDCALQRSLGEAYFVSKLFRVRWLRAVDERVPADARTTMELATIDAVNLGCTRQLGYEEVRRQVAHLRSATDECARCPLSRGQPIGCHQVLTYPVDAFFEELAFAFFCSQLDTRSSISDQIYRDLVSRLGRDTAWHHGRGPRGERARRPEPAIHTWGECGQHQVDSAQLLAALFAPMPSIAVIIGFARFWRELVSFADARLGEEMARRGVSLVKRGPN